jgi:ubiquinone/menaquinone biosynthesis C-methylase UbiE
MPIDPDAYREQSRETWGKMAPGWEARNDWMAATSEPVNEWLVRRADPQPGQVAIDIAAGPGDLGFRIAERVGDEGRVMSTDFAPQMVEVARRLGEARGLRNVEFSVLDAERMDLEDDCVDAAVCRWGYMLMGDPAAAMRETRRILRPGGPLALAVWAAPERNPWAAFPAVTLVERGHLSPPEPGAPGIFALADPDRLTEMVSAAGFGEAELEELELEFRHADFDDVWDSLVRLAGPLARVINTLPEEEREATRQAILERLAPFLGDDGSYAMPACSLGVLAR